MTPVISRIIAPVLADLLTTEPVVVVDGPRTSGKSFAVRQLVSATAGARFLDLDDPAQLHAVKADPMNSLKGPSLVVVDEFQRAAADVLGAIKAHLNRDGVTPGRYLLTGSTRADLLPELSDYLTGRHHRVTLLPYAQAEIGATQPTLLRRLLNDPESLLDHVERGEDVDDYFSRVLRGGFPLAVARATEAARGRWFTTYVDGVTSRAAEVERLRDHYREGDRSTAISGEAVLKAVFKAVAACTAQILNTARVQRACTAHLGGVTPAETSVQRWMEILEAVHLLYRLDAWGTTLRSRTTRKPKLHVVDSGLAAHFMGVTANNLGQPTKTTESGHLLETFAVTEILKELPLVDMPVQAGHFRTSDDHEVDLIIEADDGRVFGVEVKRGTRFDDKDLAGFRLLSRKLGQRFAGGVLLQPRGSSVNTGVPRVVAAPLSALWAL